VGVKVTGGVSLKAIVEDWILPLSLSYSDHEVSTWLH
jgi:hypothetical protein